MSIAKSSAAVMLLVVGMLAAAVALVQAQSSAGMLRYSGQGTLQAGKSADFIVLDANPFEAITNTRRISMVCLRGLAIDRSQPAQ